MTSVPSIATRIARSAAIGRALARTPLLPSPPSFTYSTSTARSGTVGQALTFTPATPATPPAQG